MAGPVGCRHRVSSKYENRIHVDLYIRSEFSRLKTGPCLGTQVTARGSCAFTVLGWAWWADTMKGQGLLTSKGKRWIFKLIILSQNGWEQEGKEERSDTGESAGNITNGGQGWKKALGVGGKQTLPENSHGLKRCSDVRKCYPMTL